MKSLTKKQKLLRLRTMVNLETGVLDETAFPEIHTLYARACRKKTLDSALRKCHKCPGLNIKCVTESCPGWGSLTARVFFIGQSLHEPGVESHVPFILGSGLLIEAAIKLSNIRRWDVFWTNAVRCHPLQNRQSTDREKRNCLMFLKIELKIVKPDFVVAFGNDARQSLDTILSLRDFANFNCKTLFLKHPAALYREASGEAKVKWILRLAKALDKYSEVRQ